MGEKQEKPPEGAPGWVITFADLATLLLTFFVLLLSFSSQDVVKFREMLGSVQGAFGVEVRREGAFQSELTGNVSQVEDPKKKEKEEEEKVKRQFEEVGESVAKTVSQAQLSDAVSTSQSAGELRIRVKGEVMFPPGAALISPQAAPLLDALARAIKKADLPLTVEGHTDNIPVKTALFADNWELSAARAAVVVRYLIRQGVKENKIRAVGYADFKPLDHNETPEGRGKNRRVEFVVSK
ncbi:MAG: flagellar motor protein MotB [Nitrospinae bacterium]|nr:flagellar motor protein MotB [Nitrospinota bacterium]